ncbi:hypothetical protein J1N35_022671 [Gossypium stocksii]|uniref:RNase H type-1 domain-containing protein n=1 Tax=Gossypium stocksii TaxID=47602 RepID=A0A9D3VGG3_9ROSI|nr:hypothetical protein J1N35_022671 [Gossypium stocksii]
MDYPLSDMVIDDGSWNLELFRLWVFEEVISRIVGVLLPHPFSDPDNIICKLGKKCASASNIPTYKNHISGGTPQLSSNWVPLNTNRLVRIEEGFTTAKGLMRDHNEMWKIGFSRYLGNYRVPELELWGILDGLKRIIDKSFERVLIQTYCLEVINTIKEGSFEDSNSTLVRRIHQLLKMTKHWKIQHIPREENLIANNLVRMV